MAQLAEIAGVLSEHSPPHSWMLVGGLMVQVHALAAGLSPSRATEDVDLAINLTAPDVAAANVLGALRGLGYDVVDPLDRDGPLHRLTREGQHIDLLVPDHPPRNEATRRRYRIGGRELFSAEGVSQALARPQQARIALAGTQSFTVTVPNLLGALVLKGAAWKADNRAARRHLEDAVTLAACVEDAVPYLSDLRGNDRRRLRGLHEALASGDPALARLGAAEAVRVQDTMRILATAPGPTQRRPMVEGAPLDWAPSVRGPLGR